MFLVLLKYLKPLEEVDKFRPAHIEFLEKFYAQNKFIVSGRQTSLTGGLILANVDTLEEIRQIVAQDPFSENKIAYYSFVEFTPTKYDSRFEVFLNSNNSQL